MLHCAVSKSCFWPFSELREPILMIFGLLISYARALSRENKKVSRNRKSNLHFSEKPSKLKLRDEAEKHGWEQNELQKSIKSENMIFFRGQSFFEVVKSTVSKNQLNRSKTELCCPIQPNSPWKPRVWLTYWRRCSIRDIKKLE